MFFKTILIVLVIILGLIVILPFALNMAGFNLFRSASISGGPSLNAGSGLLRSEDGGKTWFNAAESEEKRPYFPSQIYDLKFHPQNAELIFIGSKNAGLWQSKNTGKSWKKMYDKSSVLSPSADVYKIAIANSNPQVMYLAVFQNGRGRVLSSEDSGETWKEIYFVTANRFGVFDIHANPFNSQRLTIITGQGGVLETHNGGKTWRVIKWFSEPLVKLLVNPVFPAEMFVLTGSGHLFKTFDGGENWANLKEGSRDEISSLSSIPKITPFGVFTPSRQSIEALITDPNLFTTLYIGSKEGLFRSRDGGFNQERLNTLIPLESLPISSIAVDPRDSNIILATASFQLHRTSDGGINWRIENLPTSARIKNILIHPLRPDIIFAVLGQ